MSEALLSEEALVEYAKSYLKAKGFKKKNKRWTKNLGDFTLVFYIQGSCYNKEAYYIRPGVFINDCPDKEFHYYGHFMTEIKPTTPQQVLFDTETFFEEWTNADLIKHRMAEFLEREKRDPFENQRNSEVDCDKNPSTTKVFFHLRPYEIDFILNQL